MDTCSFCDRPRPRVVHGRPGATLEALAPCTEARAAPVRLDGGAVWAGR